MLVAFPSFQEFYKRAAEFRGAPAFILILCGCDRHPGLTARVMAGRVDENL
jgi:hypothetical protein